MTIQREFHDYQSSPPPGPQHYFMCSPGLLALLSDLRSRWPVGSLGCFGTRPIRGGVAPSTHSYGAALDVSFKELPDLDVRTEMIGYLVAWSAEWGVQAIHDYLGQRIWRAGRTDKESDACTLWWRRQKASAANGMGQSWAHWLHVEIHPGKWMDAEAAQDRGIL